MSIRLTFSGPLWYWRGPAPWYFVTVPDDDSEVIKDESASLTYGWGMIPATATIGGSTWKTSLFAKDGRYVVPVKADIRRAEELSEGDHVAVDLAIG
ncbi:uncharacterized protein DUF1905 [Stackebrandtia endophytica]|uniref:Uncharacterized protein DUF1905 n=1 Tax=Stackebrandtia endophytica TaxID=1496996 RepID=A0A543B115_9ACTN|nr:DUF1905 domain-containing protein [Stackebrandtia endophytica]TQL78525.1 uncharacterized protein DUF1905 [Stackebrandtia endophytica]